jgi:biotin synthase
MSEYTKLLKMPITELLDIANKTRKKYIKNNLEICSIINAKSGKCSEDCKYCAQSIYHKTNINTYPLKSVDEIFEEALTAEKNKANRFGIVTSGNTLTDDEINTICNATKKILKNSKIKVCGSLGALTEIQMKKLQDSGMDRYHHNIETSPNFYPSIVSTHSFDDRVKTIKRAQKLGFTVCSGIILGLGESWQDRIDMAVTLKDLKVDSVPFNILMPVRGTKLENNKPLPYVDIIRTIAIFRIILEDITIRFCGGRELNLKDFQGLGFLAGANAMMIGGYLTMNGRSVAEDHILIDEIQKLWAE